MKIILSSNIEHYRYAARALQRGKFKFKFICGAIYDKLPFYYKIKKSFGVWIEDRVEIVVNSENIIRHDIYEVVYKVFRNSKFILRIYSKADIDKFFNYVFDLLSKRYIRRHNDMDVYHYVGSIGYNSAKYAKKRGAIIIVDDRAEHKEFLFNILSEEYKKYDLQFNSKKFWTIDNRRDYEIADYIITPSTFSRETFIKQGIDANKLVVIPYGCNVENFYPIERESDGKFRVIYVGSLCLRKGVRYLIEAFKEIDNPNIELLLIGKIEKELEEYMRNIPNNIKHIQYIHNKELNNYYAQSDLFVLPSLSDSFSLATLEAMSSGLPVIVSENVGAKDFVKDGVNGYIVPIKNSKILKEKIIYLCENKDLAKRMGFKSREISLEVNWNKYEEGLSEFYKSLNQKNNNII